jgi:hypothetical protein
MDHQIRLHGNFALNHGEISTLCGSIEAFRASMRLLEKLSVEALEVLRDYVRDRANKMRGVDRDIRLAYAAYIEQIIREAKQDERHIQHDYD